MRLQVLLSLSLVSLSKAQEPTLLYVFSPDDCANGIFSNAKAPEAEIQHLIRNNNSIASCPTALGLAVETKGDDTIPVVRSKGTSAILLQSITRLGSGLSLELWLKPFAASSDKTLRPILTIGEQPESESFLPRQLTTCDRNALDLLVAQRDTFLEVHFRTSDTVYEACQLLRVPIESNKLVHVVVTLRDRLQQVYVNGILRQTLLEPFSNNLRHWHPNNGLLLFTHPRGNKGLTMWQGIIYQLAFAPGGWSKDNVQNRLVQGLPPTLPYSFENIVEMNEDGETQPASHEIPWYRSQPPLKDIDRFPIRVGWIDQEHRDLLATVNLSRPGSLKPYFVYITQLPHVGCLYQVDGTQLGCGGLDTPEPILLPVPIRPSHVIYQPPLNAYSLKGHSLTEITYCVSQEVLSNASQCSSSIIHVSVAPVNDPPMATPVNSTIVVREGLETYDMPRIPLLGTDVDDDDTIMQVQITQPPKHGSLILSVTSFRMDDLPHGTVLAELNWTVTGSDPVWVKYLWDPNTAPVISRDGAWDSFRFRVADRSGAWSEEEEVVVNVVSALSATSDILVIVQEDSLLQGNLGWVARDLSGLQRPVGFMIESVPTEGGLLVDAQTMHTLRPGDFLNETRLGITNESFAVTFLPHPNFCTDRMPLEIRFRAVAFGELDGDWRIVSMSEVHKQHIAVRCIIDSLALHAPSTIFSASAISMHRATLNACYGPLFDPMVTDSSKCPDAVVIEGIDITSADQHSEPVRITVLSNAGYLTFNKHAWNRIKSLIFGRRAFAKGNVTFIADTDDLPAILSSLHYQSLSPGNDVIEIQLEYGDCSANVTTSELLAPMNGTYCQILRHTFEVMILQDEAIEDIVRGDRTKGFSLRFFLTTICLPIGYLVFVQFRSMLRGKVPFLAEEITVPDDFSESWREYKTTKGEFIYVFGQGDDQIVQWETPPLEEELVPWSPEMGLTKFHYDSEDDNDAIDKVC